jgi:magnesium chelatase accessory protein
VIGLNAALGSFKGLAGWLFPVMAKALALAPFSPAVFARLSGSEARVRSLLASTGSKIDADGVGYYTRLVQDRDHVDGTLLMMAQWKLEGLLSRLPEFQLPVLLVVGERDRTVPPETSVMAAKRMPRAEVQCLPGLGHLAHEEAPDVVAKVIGEYLSRYL